MRWLYWVLFDLEIMSDEQMQKAKRVIPVQVLLGFAGLMVVMAGVIVAFANWPYVVAAALFLTVAVYIAYVMVAKVGTLSDQNPSRFLPKDSKQFKWVKRGMYVGQLFWFLKAIKLPELGMRAAWLVGLAIISLAWSWYQWQRLNQRLHVKAK
ncbi:hypothetical protein [Lacticaseibacillus porcinae]|uniref:hypothetical protein n=1 Tax=Lacticaseibacillus porcinae TaxID=1123687 RepID=UPI000F7B9CF9|nr:hypothetical protein [Lacticaseibacillus porcinae]